MTTTKKKTGRKPKSHKCSWDNQTIDGLYHCPDGRWRIVSTGYRFTEPDERLAVAHFLKLTQPKQTVTLSATVGEVCKTPLPGSVPETAEAIVAAADKVRRELDESPGSIHFDLRKAPADWDMTLEANEAHFWACVRNEILQRPKYVAMRTGIEQIGYLADIPRPTPSPTLQEVGDYSRTHKKYSDNWGVKSQDFWAQFCEFVQVKTLRELTQEHFVDYYDMIMDRADKPTYSRQRFGQIKTILNYPAKRGRWAQDCARALAFAKVLVKPKKSSADPNPIDKADFEKLLSHADGQVKAHLLLCLNLAMYGREGATVDRSELDLESGTYVSRRDKTFVVRTGVLWQRTIDAIKALPEKGPALFMSEAGTQADYDCVYGWFAKLRKAAGLPKVQLSQMRDGAFTAAFEAGISLDICKVLAGEQTGMPDHYIKRNPRMVAPACAAIESKYFPAQLRLAKSA